MFEKCLWLMAMLLLNWKMPSMYYGNRELIKLINLLVNCSKLWRLLSFYETDCVPLKIADQRTIWCRIVIDDIMSFKTKQCIMYHGIVTYFLIILGSTLSWHPGSCFPVGVSWWKLKGFKETLASYSIDNFPVTLIVK